jgi:uncharacterized protein with GYD domain
MIKQFTFVKLTEKGQLLPPEKAPGALAKVQEIVRTYHGKIETMWATTGRYDFLTVAEYPTEEDAFKARTKIMELGLFHLEAAAIFPIEAYLEAVADKKLLVTV